MTDSRDVRAESGYRPSLGVFDATILVVGSVIGVGIFVTPSDVASVLCGREHLIPVAWLLGALLALTGALTFAALAALRPYSGGLYTYISEVFGPLVGFLFGWNLLLISTTGSIAAIADIFAMHLSPFAGLGQVGNRVLAVCAIVALTALNCTGTRQGSLALNLLTVLKMAALVFVAAAGLVWALGIQDRGVPQPCPATAAAHGWIFALGAATLPVLWTFGGWQQVTYVAEEIKDAGRTAAKALVYGMGLITAIYLAVNWAYLAVMPASAMASLGSESIASAVMGIVFGPAGRIVISAAIVVSALGITHSLILTTPRVYQVMARDKVFFQWLARINPRTRTPQRAILLQGLLASILVLTMSFSGLVIYTVFAESVFFVLAGISLFWLRRKSGDPGKRVKTWGYPFTPLVFILCEVLLFVSAIRAFPRESLIGALILAAGAICYFPSRRLARRSNARTGS